MTENSFIMLLISKLILSTGICIAELDAKLEGTLHMPN